MSETRTRFAPVRLQSSSLDRQGPCDRELVPGLLIGNRVLKVGPRYLHDLVVGTLVYRLVDRRKPNVDFDVPTMLVNVSPLGASGKTALGCEYTGEIFTRHPGPDGRDRMHYFLNPLGMLLI